MELPVIFLVDPDVEAAEAVVSHLSAQGWWVSVVQDSDAALRVAAAHAPNLVIVHRRAAPFDGLIEAFGRHAGGPGVILLEVDDETEIPAGADALLPGACDGPTLVSAARQLIREPREVVEAAVPVVPDPAVPEPVLPEPALPEPPAAATEELSEKFTSADIFGDMLDAPIDDTESASVVELTRVPTPLDGRTGSVTARVHFTGNAAAPAAGQEGRRMAGVALADLADPVEMQPESSSVPVSGLVEAELSTTEEAADLVVDAPAVEVLEAEVLGTDTAVDLEAPPTGSDWVVAAEDPEMESSPIVETPVLEGSAIAGSEAAADGAPVDGDIFLEDPVSEEVPLENTPLEDKSGDEAVADGALAGDVAPQPSFMDGSLVEGDVEGDTTETTAPVAEAEGFADWLSSPEPDVVAEPEAIELGLGDDAIDLGSIDSEPSESSLGDSGSETPLVELADVEAGASEESTLEEPALEQPVSEVPVPEVAAPEVPAPEVPMSAFSEFEEPADDDVVFLGEVGGDEPVVEEAAPEVEASAGRWFEEGAADSSEEVHEIELTEEEAEPADLAQFEAIVESKQADEALAEEPEPIAFESSIEESDSVESEEEGESEELSSPSNAWASVLAGMPADSADVEEIDSPDPAQMEIPESAFDGVSGASQPTDSVGFSEEPEREVIDLSGSLDEATEAEGDEASMDVAADEALPDEEPSDEESTVFGEESAAEEAVDEPAEAAATEEAARFVFPTAEEPGDDLEEMDVPEVEAVEATFEAEAEELEGAEIETPEGESEPIDLQAVESETLDPETLDPETTGSGLAESESELAAEESSETSDSWTSSGYSVGENSDAEIETVTDFESPSDADEIELPPVASSLADPPLPQTAAMENSLSAVAEGAKVEPPFASGTGFDSAAEDVSTSGADLSDAGEVQPAAYEALDSGTARAAASANLSWLWMVAVVAILAIGGWLWLRNRGAETSRPDSRSADTPAAVAGEGASASEGQPAGADASDRSSSSEAPSSDSASAAAAPAARVEESEVDSLLDEGFGEREREIRERFEIERQRLEEQLEALRSQRVQDAQGTSQR